MEHFNRSNPRASHQSRDSSVSSLESSSEFAFPTYNGSPMKIHTRAVSSTPSYMNHIPINRKPVGSRNITPDSTSTTNQTPLPPPPPPEPKGSLILAIAASPHNSTISYLQSMLKKSSYNQIIILGLSEKEAELKQLKVEIYALLGKLGKEISITMYLHSTWEEEEITSSISRNMGQDSAIHGVLCCPSYTTTTAHAAETNIMNTTQTDLEKPWKSSISFLHSVAKTTLPHLRTGGHEYKKPALFLVTSPAEQTPISTLYNAGCRTLMTLLVAANAGKSLTIDYAENVLLPEPERVVPETNSNGRPVVGKLRVNGNLEEDESPPPESPTKLWALYNELGAAD